MKFMAKINKNKLNKRQRIVLAFVKKKEIVSIGEVFERVQKSKEGDITRITVFRDLKKLVRLNLIERKGESKRASVYHYSS
jgi:Fe2+ or Zn2+ uptake regulation protein